uniref:Uncharacterized protein n=1 Tax=Arundo donax TaxID=35708 RepID=A0A0A9A1S1_ARUDO
MRLLRLCEHWVWRKGRALLGMWWPWRRDGCLL